MYKNVIQPEQTSRNYKSKRFCSCLDELKMIHQVVVARHPLNKDIFGKERFLRSRFSINEHIIFRMLHVGCGWETVRAERRILEDTPRKTSRTTSLQIDFMSILDGKISVFLFPCADLEFFMEHGGDVWWLLVIVWQILKISMHCLSSIEFFFYLIWDLLLAMWGLVLSFR